MACGEQPVFWIQNEAVRQSDKRMISMGLMPGEDFSHETIANKQGNGHARPSSSLQSGGDCKN